MNYPNLIYRYKMYAIKVRLYLSKKQESDMRKLLGSCRFVYNQLLAYKKTAYETDKTKISYNDMSFYFHNVLRENKELPWLLEHNTKVIKQSIRNLDKAYQNFYKKLSDFPKFKKKHDNKQSCRFPKEAVSKEFLTNNKLNLTTKFKNLKFKCSDKYLSILNNIKHSDIENITITKTVTGKFYASICLKLNRTKDLVKTDKAIGVDLGIKTLAYCSNGQVFENNKFKKRREKQIKRLQRELSKRIKGSKNREKTRIKLARVYETITNQKNNYLHYVTNKLINENQVIILESLNVKGMLSNHKLAESIQNLSLSELVRQLEYKTKWYGKELIRINTWFPSSKKCSECGNVKKDLKLSERTYDCYHCGVVLDRDFNASLNILTEGLRLRELGITDDNNKSDKTKTNKSKKKLKDVSTLKVETT